MTGSPTLTNIEDGTVVLIWTLGLCLLIYLLHDPKEEPALEPLCPECRNGKHVNCTGWAVDEETDEIVLCACDC